MTQHQKYHQLRLFTKDKPPVELAAAQMAELAKLIETLLKEIATALANREKADDQNND